MSFVGHLLIISGYPENALINIGLTISLLQLVPATGLIYLVFISVTRIENTLFDQTSL